MFLAQHLTNNQQNDYVNRNDLLSYVEKENARLKAVNQVAEMTLIQSNENGEILQKKRIQLPFQGTVEELLQDFGFVDTGKKSKLVFPFKKEKGATDTTIQNSQTVQTVQGSSASNPLKAFSGLKMMLLVILLIGLFGGYSVILAGQNKRLKTEVTSLENKVNNLSNLQAVAPQVDVFSRYFISSFYANDRDILDQYLTDSLKKEIEIKDGQLQSVVFEGVKKNGKNYQVSYVLQINQEESKRTVRLTFDVQSDKSGRYGWLVTSQPKEGLYPG